MTPTKKTVGVTHRRRFLTTTGIALGALGKAPQIIAQSKTSETLIVGQGQHQYEVQHNWATLPSKYSWQTTHNIAVDRDGLVYVIHEGRRNLADHPSIFVFDPNGRFIHGFGNQFQGGGHGLDIRTEGDQQFLYVTGYQHLKNFAKLTLQGEVVWEKRAPMETGLYPAGEDTAPKQRWGRDAFMPTNYAFKKDGGFYLADGYGSFTIHSYDAKGDYVSTFGKPGKGPGEFNLPHGIWMDQRESGVSKVVVADRANGRLQWFTEAGKHLKTLAGFILPANIDAHGDLLLVPDLSARVTLVDKQDNLIHLGEDQEWRDRVMANNRSLRGSPKQKGWRNGRFLHPHDACFDKDGNILVAEWVHEGRISRLRKLT